MLSRSETNCRTESGRFQREAIKPPPLRMLFIGNYLPGVASVSHELSEHLVQSGYIVQHTSSRRNQVARLADMLFTTLKCAKDYDVAHIDLFSGRAFLFAEATATLLRRLNKPFVITLHGGALPEFATRHPFRIRRLLASATAVVAPSEYLQQALLAYRQDIRVIPNAIDLSHYQQRPPDRQIRRIAWVRAFHQVYNPVIAPVVLAHLGPEFRAVELFMYGRDKGDGSLAATRAMADRQGVASRVHFCGRIDHDQVSQALYDCDIFLNTADIDNTPLSVIEAMASGLCVVSTNVGGISYLLRHEHDAMLAPAHNVDALAAAIRCLLTEHTLATQISAYARRKAEQFDWQLVIPSWHSLLTACTSYSARNAYGRRHNPSPPLLGGGNSDECATRSNSKPDA